MKFFETSKYFSLKKSTYITLRWIGFFGQLLAIYTVHRLLEFEFNFLLANLAILVGILSNLFLIYIYKKTQLSERSAFIFLIIDILQLTFLLYLTGGVANPFIIFLIIPSIFSSFNLGFRINVFIVVITSISILSLTFFYQPLPSPLNLTNSINEYVYYSIPLALISALIFMNYFALSFEDQTRLRKEALSRMDEVMAKEHELLSLGGQAAAAAHSLGTPLSTIKLVAQELKKQFKDQKDVEKDIELLTSQVDRCNEILKRLSINANEEDDFIDEDLSVKDYLDEIITSFENISDKNFVFNFDQNSNHQKIIKSIEIIYGLRNFIGNANKFAKKNIFITLKSDSEFTEITVEDDGPGYPNDILSKIGEPYLKTFNSDQKSRAGLGLGIFIGKTLLEKNFANVNCRNSKTRSGAEVIIKWKNKDLFNI
ncbi:ActS/PrrB/RegB family redox-sensitive histidine kinase [Candidatus Pelagibacter bacterium]|jgi:two-component system sensor histidine kinase RegB|nr:ActS/PrrB/RegB family redox-sensitive histidine kinase [Candidatus Pelagibacter bacterium]